MKTLVKPPSFLQRLSSDEYLPLAYEDADLRVLARVRELLADAQRGVRAPQARLLRDRARTAAGLVALNKEWGESYYRVPESAVADDAAAAQAFRGRGVVIDVQTHFKAPHATHDARDMKLLRDMYLRVMPDWWRELDDIVAYNLVDYVRKIYMDSETAVVVLSSGPGYDEIDDTRSLFNAEMAATRALVNHLAGSGRLLNHTVVQAQLPAEIEKMAEWRERFKPVGWKVYTPGRRGPNGWTEGWMLDDEEHGYPFLERARAVGVKRICAHKGISVLVDNGSPRDIGPVAKAFPDLTFIVYHSGYEMPVQGNPPEGPYTEQTLHQGVNRLIHSVQKAGLGPGGNVYAELGTTWFCLVRRPVEAAHVLGKLIHAFGEDNVIWGSDTIWYGSPQPVIDAFRAFQIPDEMCARFGYQPLTPEVKEKILSRNAARVYGIDLERARRFAETDDLAWAAKLIANFEAEGFPALR